MQTGSPALPERKGKRRLTEHRRHHGFVDHERQRKVPSDTFRSRRPPCRPARRAGCGREPKPVSDRVDSHRQQPKLAAHAHVQQLPEDISCRYPLAGVPNKSGIATENPASARRTANEIIPG